MKTLIGLFLISFSFLAYADARFVEAPAECHLPWDNANVNNEYKLQSCEGVLVTKNGGGTVDAMVSMDRTAVNGAQYTLTGEDVRIPEDYPGGELKITTSGDDSGTDCNIVDAGGNEFATGSWTSETLVKRTASPFLVDVNYRLSCVNATQAQ